MLNDGFDMNSFVTSIGFALLATAVYADDTFWVIPEAQAQCILENRDQYLAQPGDLILILVEQCPNVDLFAGALSGQENFGGIGDVQTGTGLGSFDEMISYTPVQLECLATEMIVFDGEFARLPKFVKCDD